MGVDSPTFSLTLALDGVGVGGQRPTPAVLPPVKTTHQLYRRLGGPRGRFGRVWNTSTPPPHQDSIPGRSSP